MLISQRSLFTWCRSAGALVLVAGMSVVTAGHATASGTWGPATPAVFGSGVQNATQEAYFTSVSCGSAGNCTAAGQFLTAAGGFEAFTMTSIDNTPSSTTTTVAPSTSVAALGVSLPATGSDSSGPLVMALFAVVAGVAMMVRRRRLVD